MRTVTEAAESAAGSAVGSADERWLACGQLRPDAVRLYCFPSAGGSASDYLRWSNWLPGVEVWGIQPPGQGPRQHEQPFRRVDDLVAALLDSVAFRPPYALFGHSLGALVAFETARALRDRAVPQPRALILSGYPAPDLPRPGEHRHRERPELLANYRYVERPPLAMTMTIVDGVADHEVPELVAWHRQTTGEFQLHRLPGDHSYLHRKPSALARLITSTLAGPNGPGRHRAPRQRGAN